MTPTIHINDWDTHVTQTIILDGGVAFCQLDLPGTQDPPYHQKRAWLHELSVLPEYRKKNYGTKLIEICKQIALDNGRDYLSLWVKPGSWQEEWYKRLGFTLNGFIERNDGTNVYDFPLH